MTILSTIAEEFLRFLLEIHKKTGKNSFVKVEYLDFVGHEEAIIDLWNRGIIERENDILGTITVRLPEK